MICVDSHRKHITICDGPNAYSACIHIPAVPDSASTTAVIFLHSLHGCKLGPNNLYPLLADRLAGAGIYGVRFDCRGNGESPGHMTADMRVKADDASAIIRYCARTLGASRICLLCISDVSSLVFHLRDELDLVSGVIFLSPKFTHLEGKDPDRGRFAIRLREYIRKMCRLETCRRLLGGRIDVRAVMSVLRESVRAPMGDRQEAVGASRLRANSQKMRRMVSLLVIGENDPYSKKNLMEYRPFIDEYQLPWNVQIIRNAGHNFGSDEERERLVGHILAYLEDVRDSGPETSVPAADEICRSR